MNTKASNQIAKRESRSLCARDFNETNQLWALVAKRQLNGAPRRNRAFIGIGSSLDEVPTGPCAA